MKKINPQTLIDSFLFRAPHKMMGRVGQIAYIPQPLKMPNDDIYVDHFISRVHCDYLTTKQFAHFQSRPLKLVREMIFAQYSHQSTLNGKKLIKSELESKLINSVKNLNDLKSTYAVYLQTEELITMMTPQEAYNYKKFLVYIFKWIFNQQGRASHQFKRLGQSLKITVVDKIYEAHESMEERMLMRDILERIETLAIARESLEKGDNEQAKISYEAIFKDENSDADARMEALEYLCKESKKNGDQSYLLGMIVKIKKQSGQQRHRKYIESILNQLRPSAPCSDGNAQQQ